MADYEIEHRGTQQFVVTKEGEDVATYALEQEAHDAVRQMNDRAWQEGERSRDP